MQDRVLNYYNRMRFIREMKTLPIHQFYLPKFMDPVFTGELNKIEMQNNRDRFFEELENIFHGIYKNTLDCYFERVDATGNYFIDWLNITLSKAIGMDPMVIHKNEIRGNVNFYEKEESVVIFERIIERAMALWQFRKEDTIFMQTSTDAARYYGNLVHDTLEWVTDTKYDDTNSIKSKSFMTEFVEFRSYGSDTYMKVEEDGSIVKTNKANPLLNGIEISGFANSLQLSNTELYYLSYRCESIAQLADNINDYNDTLDYIAKNGIDSLRLFEVKQTTNDDIISIRGTAEINKCFKTSTTLAILNCNKKEFEKTVKERVLAHLSRSNHKLYIFLTTRPEAIKSFECSFMEYTKFRFELTFYKDYTNEYFSFTDHFVNVGRISIERAADNNNTKTFDFIKAEILTAKLDKEGLVLFADKFRNQLLERVKDKIEASKRFQKFGVPFNYLTLTDIIVTNDLLIVFIFELKDVNR